MYCGNKNKNLLHRATIRSAVSAAMLWIMVSGIRCTTPLEPPAWNNLHDPFTEGFLPESPSNVKIIQHSDRRTEIRWKRESIYDVGVEVYRKHEAGTYAMIGTFPPDSTSMTDTAFIDVHSKYYYRIVSVSQRGLRGDGREVLFVPEFPSPVLLAPRDTGRTGVVLEWIQTSWYGDGIVIERSKQGDPFQCIDSVPVAVSSYIDSPPDTTSMYTYRVRTFTAGNVSDPSNSMKVDFRPELLYNQSLGITGLASAIAVAPHQTYFALGKANSGNILLFNAFDQKLIRTISNDGWTVLSVAFSHDGEYLAAGFISSSLTSNGVIRIWKTSDGTLLRQWDRAFGVNSVTFSPDGKYLASDGYCTPPEIGQVAAYTSIVDIANDSIVLTLSGSNGIAFSPDQKYIATGNGGLYGSVAVWNFPGGVKYGDINQQGYSKCAQYFLDGSRIAFLSSDQVYVADGSTLKKEFQSDLFSGFCFDMDVRDDGKYIIASMQNIVRMWRTKNWEQVISFKAEAQYTDPVYALKYLSRHFIIKSGVHGTTVFYVNHRWVNIP